MKNDEIIKLLIRDYTDYTVEIAKILLKSHAQTQRDWKERDYQDLLDVIRMMRKAEDQILLRAEFLNG